MMKKYITIILILFLTKSYSQDLMRPVFHFTPNSGWMNDPNGMVFYQGQYHLFFQHNPNDKVWGPMHWGHAVSKDLIHWQEQKIALFPDSLGTIFSGSAVIDKNNTAGFGRNAMIAIYTNHNHEIEREKTGVHQVQSIAYSIDAGKTWIKYAGNPVIPNPGIPDFRDPKVIWHEPSKSWVMILATLDRITFYGSKNLKKWEKLSDFGANQGNHGGVWECPDLLKFNTPGGEKWVLLVSINPGGPNGGSATQYFVGEFDGKVFHSDPTKDKWLDYGPDNYAGVTFSNLGERHVLMGWMSNWLYANQVPASTWRSGNTIARELILHNIDDEYYLKSTPVKELDKYRHQVELRSKSNENEVLIDGMESLYGAFEISFSVQRQDFRLMLATTASEKLFIGFDNEKNSYFIDRSKTGDVDFNKHFANLSFAPRSAQSDEITVRLLFDRNSVELFADQGETCMSALFFNKNDFHDLIIKTSSAVKSIKNLKVFQIK